MIFNFDVSLLYFFYSCFKSRSSCSKTGIDVLRVVILVELEKRVRDCELDRWDLGELGRNLGDIDQLSDFIQDKCIHRYYYIS